VATEMIKRDGVSYDPEADAMYIEVRAGDYHRTILTDSPLYLDVDAEGRVIGIEILNVTEFLSPLIEGLKVREEKAK
jgi:uncharacterized protein YuzE